LTLAPCGPLELRIRGPYAGATGTVSDNLVLAAAQTLVRKVQELKLGRFVLDKRLPVAAGLGGGSADAAAALRLLARANALAADDPRLFVTARATGADVPVCLVPVPRMMRGIGDVLSEPLDLPVVGAVLANPGLALATRDVFARLGLAAGEKCGDPVTVVVPTERDALLSFLADQSNELEPAAISLAPVIADVLASLRALPACRLSRMSGSGATCFALFDSGRAAAAAARRLKQVHPAWWVCATAVGPVRRLVRA